MCRSPLLISLLLALFLVSTSIPAVAKLSKACVAPRDCQEIQAKGYHTSGVYKIFPAGTNGVHVYCDMKTDGGGWTVFQRRMDGSENFFRTWNEYKYGFGNIKREHWLGNKLISIITSSGWFELRINMKDYSNIKRYASYREFSVGPESTFFKLFVSGYRGNAGDSLSSHSGYRFSTKDKDSHSCAATYKGAWWYAKCHASNLNGLFHRGATGSFATGVVWHAWKGYYYSLKSTTMMMRRYQS